MSVPFKPSFIPSKPQCRPEKGNKIFFCLVWSLTTSLEVYQHHLKTYSDCPVREDEFPMSNEFRRLSLDLPSLPITLNKTKGRVLVTEVNEEFRSVTTETSVCILWTLVLNAKGMFFKPLSKNYNIFLTFEVKTLTIPKKATNLCESTVMKYIKQM